MKPSFLMLPIQIIHQPQLHDNISPSITTPITDFSEDVFTSSLSQPVPSFDISEPTTEPSVSKFSASIP